jgi:hypothetical protein
MPLRRTFTNKTLRVACVLSEWQVADEERDVTVWIVKLLWLLPVDGGVCGDGSSSLAQVDGHSAKIFLYRIDLVGRRAVKLGAGTTITVCRYRDVQGN